MTRSPSPRGDFSGRQLGKTYDRGEDVVEVVGDPAGERAQGLHLLGLAELGFEFLPLGDVARGRKDAHHGSRLIPVDRGVVKDRGNAVVPVADIERIVTD